MVRQRLLTTCAAFIFFTIAVVYITYPLPFHMDSLVSGWGDELVIAWIQNWVVHSLFTNPLEIFQANTYYPYHNTLAYSDAFFISSVLGFPALWLLKEPVVLFNFTFISSLIMLGFFTYLLSMYLTKNFLASFLSGLLLVFSPAVLDKRVHLQVLAIQWVPLALLFFFLFINKKKSRYFILSIIFFIVQTLNSFLPGYFIIFSYVVISVFAFMKKKLSWSVLLRKKHMLVCFLAALLLLPVIVPYYQVSQEFSYTRDIREAIHYALQPEDLLVPNDDSRLQSIMTTLTHQKDFKTPVEVKNGYIGFVFSLLVIYAFFRFINRIKKNSFYFSALFMTGIVGLITSLGPALHLFRKTIHHPFPIILPYALFYYVLPGFNGFRNSARFEMLFVLCSAVSVGILLHEITKRMQQRKRVLLFLALFAGIVAEFRFPMQFIKAPQLKDFPPVYRWVATTPREAVIIELPVYNWYMAPYINNQRMRQFYSTQHFRKTVSGASGFSPPPWQQFVEKTVSEFPSPESLRQLKQKRIQYLLVYKKEYDELASVSYQVRNKKIPDGKSVVSSLNASDLVSYIQTFDDVYVYKMK